MFIKVLTVGLIALFATSEAGCPRPKILTRWDSDAKAGYIEMPRTCEHARLEGWRQIPNDLSLNYTLLTIYRNFGLYYSENCETVVGIRIRIPCSERVRSSSGIDYDKLRGLAKYTGDGACGYVGRILFNTNTAEKGYSFSILGVGSASRIPNNASLLQKYTLYQKKRCIPRMGELWYQVSSTETKCTKLDPWSLMVQNNTVIGVGFQMFGKTKFGWLNEPIQAKDVEYGMKGPHCIRKYIKKYGFISMHFWFSGHPATIDCSCKN